jgi:GNAT superfamily N-acetyltransferase
MEVGAHLARLEELGLVVGLVAEGRKSIVDSKGAAEWLERDAPEGPLEDRYSKLISGPGSAVVIGTVDTVPLGVLALREAQGAEGPVGDIAEIYVDPQARGVGVAEAMMDAAFEWTERSGMAGLGGRSLPGDRQTKGLFERYGLVARSIEVYRPLRPPVSRGER